MSFSFRSLSLFRYQTSRMPAWPRSLPLRYDHRDAGRVRLSLRLGATLRPLDRAFAPLRKRSIRLSKISGDVAPTL